MACGLLSDWPQRMGSQASGWRLAQRLRRPYGNFSGAFGHKKVRYVAQPADRMDSEMSTFLEWFNGSHDLDPFVKAAIAHLWFVAIHPFGGGNGRITRTIADMTLARSDGGYQRLYSMSAAIERAHRLL